MGSGRKRNSHDTSDAAKRVLKSLITLDSYEPDVSDDVQNELMWNEQPSGENSLAGTPTGLTSKATSNNNNTKAESRSESPASEEAREKKNAAEEQFQREEAERDAALPEEYRKFRPKGYGFKLPPKDRPVRIYADGVFDLFHLGHMKQLEQAKKSLPNVTMVVGVPNDKLVHSYKGLTVLSDEQRYESLRHCRWVDEVVPNAPWEVNEEFLNEHQIDYVAHDDLPYAGPDGQDDVYKFVKERGQFMTTQRTDGISTSDIITRIVRDYDLYLMRNFKRGVSRKELNVSWMKKNELDIKRHVNAFRESWRNNVESATRDMYADLLAYALNAPSNSVVGRARDWVTRHMESRNGSPPSSDGEETPPSSPNKSDSEASQSGSDSDASMNSPGKSPHTEEEAAELERSPKRRRVSSH